MKRSILITAAIALIAGAAIAVAPAEARASITRTETAQAYILGHGPADAGLGAYPSDLTIMATRTTTFDADGHHVANTWFDKFTLFDPVSGEPSLSCSAAGPVSNHGVDISDDLTMAALDASAAAMKPEGDPSTGIDDSLACPGISLRVIMTWHSTDGTNPRQTQAADDGCSGTHRMLTVDASAVGVTLTSPTSANPSVIQHDPSTRASISRDLGARTQC